MAQIWEYIKIALMNIKSNKGRSILTMLGIIIGIASVIMIIAIGGGVRGAVNSQLDGIGGGQIYLYVDSRKNTTTSFRQEDLEYLKEKIPHVKGATLNYGGRGTAKGSKGSLAANATGGTADQQYTSAAPMLKGKYFTEGDYQSANRVCVVTESGARALFGNTDVIGMSFELSLDGITQEMTIVGVRQDNPSTFINMGSGNNKSLDLELPASVLAADYGYWLERFSEILVIADSPAVSAEVAGQAVRLLESKYNVRGEGQIMVQNFTDVSSRFNSILGVITLFISLVAAISLLVGGIGVMNIMLVSVTERTREIGIRKALGARTGSILTQFLAEAGIITLLGGIIGIVLGYLGAFGVCAAMGLSADVQMTMVLAATVFSSAVGIFFGIYPAKKAARLSPIEALRHE